jgi:hypothetical protein
MYNFWLWSEIVLNLIKPERMKGLNQKEWKDKRVYKIWNFIKVSQFLVSDFIIVF